MYDEDDDDKISGVKLLSRGVEALPIQWPTVDIWITVPR